MDLKNKPIKWVYEMPKDILNEFIFDVATRVECLNLSDAEKTETIDYVFREKLVNVIDCVPYNERYITCLFGGE